MMTAGIFTGTPPAELAAEARRIIAHVRDMTWPESREARLSIGWQYGETKDALAEYSAVLADEAVLSALGIPDMNRGAGHEDQKRRAAEWTAGRALECATELLRRLGQYQGAGNGTGGEQE
jgi:hypothetical protein